MKATAKSIAHWATTGIAVFTMFRGGILALVHVLVHVPERINCTTQLAYSMDFLMNIGIRLLGSLALVAPAVTHLMCRGAAWHVIATLGLAALALAF